MFKVNDVVIYGTHGICKIVDIEEKIVSKVSKKYFVLKPINNNDSTFFMPTDNETLLKKMRRILTKEEVHSLIDAIPEEDTTWIANDKERKAQYKKNITNGDHLELIKMIKAIRTHKKECEAKKIRLHILDEDFCKEAEDLLCREFQYVLNISSKTALKKYINSRMSAYSLLQSR